MKITEVTIKRADEATSVMDSFVGKGLVRRISMSITPQTAGRKSRITLKNDTTLMDVSGFFLRARSQP